MKSKLTQKALKEMLNYNLNTGEWLWVVNWSRKIRSGAIAGAYNNGGSKNKSVYRVIRINGKNHMVHRLAFLYVTGKFPVGEIDHEDGNGLNNKWSNLKEVTSTENSKNLKIPVNNTTGIMGVYWFPRTRKWQSKIGVKGKSLHLGYFDKIEDAAKARTKAEKRYNFHPNHGKR